MTIRTTACGALTAEAAAAAIAKAIEGRENFDTAGALQGEARPHLGPGYYVIWSYHEPIIVVRYAERRAIVSTYKHSYTTARHRNRAAAALAQIDGLVVEYVDHRILSDGSRR